MMDNSNQAPEAAPSAAETDVSSSATIKVTGILFDRSARHPVDSADIELRQGSSRVLTLTGPKGEFQVELPRAGDWKIGPDKTSYPGFYDFFPTSVTVRGPGDVGTIQVDSDTAANARALEKAVKNIFISAEKLFEKGMKKYQGQPNLSELDVQIEAAVAFEILSGALNSVVGHISEAQTEAAFVALEKDCAQSANGSFLLLTGGVCCTTCRRRYAGNQAALQQCLCCPDRCVSSC